MKNENIREKHGNQTWKSLPQLGVFRLQPPEEPAPPATSLNSLFWPSFSFLCLCLPQQAILGCCYTSHLVAPRAAHHQSPSAAWKQPLERPSEKQPKNPAPRVGVYNMTNILTVQECTKLLFVKYFKWLWKTCLFISHNRG